jgi:hypothetical protein
MENLDTRILALSSLDRAPLIEALIGIDRQMQSRARSGRRKKFGSTERYRADEALSDSDRLGRIIYFLRFRSPASGATAQDMRLCNILEEKLRLKNQWIGEHSI